MRTFELKLKILNFDSIWFQIFSLDFQSELELEKFQIFTLIDWHHHQVLLG